MSELWGVAQGLRVADQDRQEKQLFSLTQQEGQLKVQSAQMTLAQQKAQLEYWQHRQAKKLSGISEGGAVGDPNDPFNSSMQDMSDMQQAALASGNFKEATDITKAMSTVARNHQTIMKESTEEAIKESGTFSNLLETVHDEASWQAAKSNWSQMFGKKTLYDKQAYSPELVEMLKQAAETRKSKAERQAADARKAVAKSQLDLAPARKALIEEQTRLAKAREEHLGKAGGSGLAAKSGTVRAVDDKLVTLIDAPAEERRVLARAIAEDVEKIQKETGLPLSKAVARAVINHKDDLGGYRKQPQGMGSRTNPLTPPTREQIRSGEAQLKDNSYYRSKTLGLLHYTNGKFITVESAPLDEQPVDEGDSGDSEDEEAQ